MTINERIEAIHRNAVDHGFAANRPYGEIFALIHAELSEALEEDRAGRPNIWHECGAIEGGRIATTEDCQRCMNVERVCGKTGTCGVCSEYGSRKPEGAAVELADAIIRMLDFCGGHRYRFSKDTFEDLIKDTAVNFDNVGILNFASDIGFAHYILSKAMADTMADTMESKEQAVYSIELFVAFAAKMIGDLGEDVDAVIDEKCAYNRSRPFKHGKKY